LPIDAAQISHGAIGKEKATSATVNKTAESVIFEPNEIEFARKCESKMW
jgi:hypothetical protein